ncbi:MAG: hypothetical protein ABWX84_15095 [Nocardioides sp.]
MERSAYWTAEDEQPVTREEAEKAWAVEAQQVLTRVAATYRGTIESNELANELQQATGIHTRAQVRTWLGSVLTTMARQGHELGEPPLASLVVQKSTGMVGTRYDEILKATGAEPAATDYEREKLAADARLECYRWADADMPDDGGKAALTARYAASESRARKQRLAEAPANVCPTCFMAIPPTGECDNCG